MFGCVDVIKIALVEGVNVVSVVVIAALTCEVVDYSGCRGECPTRTHCPCNAWLDMARNGNRQSLCIESYRIVLSARNSCDVLSITLDSGFAAPNKWKCVVYDRDVSD